MSRLAEALRSGRFVVTAEIGPPRGADPDAVTDKAQLLRGWVDAANITDNQGAHVRLSSLAGGVLTMRAGVEPVVQLTCRDRNRLALQSELVSAGALGVPNVLLLTGDHPKFGDHPDAKPVFDLDGVQLVWTARTMRDNGRLISGRPVNPAPRWLIGSVENPFAPPQSFRAQRLAKKVAAGAEFVQTQFVFDREMFERWMVDVRELGIPDRCGILAGVGVVRSLRSLEYMRTKVPGIHVPDAIVARLRGVPGDRVAAEGARLCVETLQWLSTVDGVAGAHVMAFGAEQVVPEILEAARLGPGGPAHAAQRAEGVPNAG
ncbi:MAG: methylenetetrahydrofolate reductase [Micromonosporaceae bacterium]|nr:methylenetetrahydrofolate reductase [Micromonosporaceae bacterium]